MRWNMKKSKVCLRRYFNWNKKKIIIIWKCTGIFSRAFLLYDQQMKSEDAIWNHPQWEEFKMRCWPLEVFWPEPWNVILSGLGDNEFPLSCPTGRRIWKQDKIWNHLRREDSEIWCNTLTTLMTPSTDMTVGLSKMKMMDISEMMFRDDGRWVADINSFFTVTDR